MRVEISDGVIWRDLGGDIVILNVETGVYFGLDGSGGQIWRELAKHGSIEKTFESLRQRFDAESDELRRDIDEMVNQFVQKRLVRLIAKPGRPSGEPARPIAKPARPIAKRERAIVKRKGESR